MREKVAYLMLLLPAEIITLILSIYLSRFLFQFLLNSLNINIVNETIGSWVMAFVLALMHIFYFSMAKLFLNINLYIEPIIAKVFWGVIIYIAFPRRGPISLDFELAIAMILIQAAVLYSIFSVSVYLISRSIQLKKISKQ